MSHPDGTGPHDPTDDYVRSALRDAAQAYQPDRAAMAHRVAAGRATTRARRRHGYPIAAALAVAVIAVLSVVAVRSAADHGRRTVAGPPVAAPAPSATTTPPSRPPAPSRSATTPAGNGLLTAQGRTDPHSVATWSEQNVTIRNAKTLTALRVTVTVSLTAGTADAGRYTTVPNSDVTVTVTRAATALSYAYVLKPGVRLPPGTYVFAAQFTHRSGRDAGRDGYAVTAAGGGGTAELSGSFA
jgi:hypothetical protein